MMKRGLAILLTAGLIFSFTLSCFSEGLKIGYVDIFEVFNEYDKTKDYDSNLEKKKEEIEKKLDAKKKTIEKLQNKLGLLKEEERAREEEKIMEEVKAYKDLEREAFTDIKKARDDKMKEIIDDINKIIKNYARENAFNLIISKNSVLYGDDAVVDITAAILKISNQEYKKK